MTYTWIIRQILMNYLDLKKSDSAAALLTTYLFLWIDGSSGKVFFLSWWISINDDVFVLYKGTSDHLFMCIFFLMVMGIPFFANSTIYGVDSGLSMKLHLPSEFTLLSKNLRIGRKWNEKLILTLNLLQFWKILTFKQKFQM